jgi:hypothetical protein
MDPIEDVQKNAQKKKKKHQTKAHSICCGRGTPSVRPSFFPTPQTRART